MNSSAAELSSFRDNFANIKTDAFIQAVAICIAVLLLIIGAMPWLVHAKQLFAKAPTLRAARAVQSSSGLRLESRHMFGIYVQDYAHLPITTLPLALQGTMIDPTNAKQSIAIISVENNASKSYRVNQKLSVGASIVAIHSDYCVLDHSGRLEK